MTIHHDKLAYGKLASMRKDLSEDELLKMLKALSEEGENKEEENKTAIPEKNGKDGK